MRNTFIKITKMHGTGNSFVVIYDQKGNMLKLNEFAKLLCNINYGVGADGLIVVSHSTTADFNMKIFNSDGSEAEMCGNGIRCLGKFVYENNLTKKKVITISTLGGIKKLTLSVTPTNVVTSVTVEMGQATLNAVNIGLNLEKASKISLEQELEINNKVYEAFCLSMGNPHAVVFVNSSEELQNLDLEHIGPLFENNEIFSNRTNTEFVHVIDNQTIELRVWERGCGETLSCGTGACAAVVASVLNRRTTNEVTVRLLGGELKIKFDFKNNILHMTGPAVTIFSGDLQIPKTN